MPLRIQKIVENPLSRSNAPHNNKEFLSENISVSKFTPMSVNSQLYQSLSVNYLSTPQKRGQVMPLKIIQHFISPHPAITLQIFPNLPVYYSPSIQDWRLVDFVTCKQKTTSMIFFMRWFPHMQKFYISKLPWVAFCIRKILSCALHESYSQAEFLFLYCPCQCGKMKKNATVILTKFDNLKT